MEKELSVLHTANAGVLLKIGNNTLGIDMFSRDPEGLYQDTPEELKIDLLGRIEKGEIQTLLFTHEHGDHFCPEDVQEALRRNPKLCIISNEAVIGQIRRLSPQAEDLRQIPRCGTENASIELPGFSLELFYYRHMGEAYAQVENLVCMVRTKMGRLFIPGDAWPEEQLFARVEAWSENIGWMMAPFPLVGLPSVRRAIDSHLRIGHILAFHLPRPERDDQSWLAGAKNVCSRAKDGLPAPVFAEKLGEKYDIF
jgi:hypothetical protein